MSTHPLGWTPDDYPLDLAAVAADDATVEALRVATVEALRAGSPQSLRLGAGDDVALLLVQELLRDVGADLPAATGRYASTGLRAVDPLVTTRRALRSGAFVAALAAGVLSLGGAAAAATLAPEGSPLRAAGDAVRSAAGAVVDAVTPPQTPSAVEAQAPRAELPTPAASTATTARSAPGAAATVAHAASAERAVVSLLDSAARRLAAGRPGPAGVLLDTAERRLAEVPATAAAGLRTRLAALRAEVAAVAAAAAAAPADPGRGRGTGPATAEEEVRPSAGERPVEEPAVEEPAVEEPAGGAPKGRPVRQPPAPPGPASSR